MSDRCWPSPRRRDGAVFGDLTLYMQALELASKHDSVTAIFLQQELKPRLLAEHRSVSVAQGLVEELQLFGWLATGVHAANGHATRARLTPQGHQALETARHDGRAFLRILAERMHAVYVVPGWFVDRLWTINPSQGEVVLPAPAAEWSPSKQTQLARAWTGELREQTIQAAQHARMASPLTFPIDDPSWHGAVRAAWERLRDRKRRQEAPGPDPLTGSRSGLTLAMRAAGLGLLFGAVPFGQTQTDFDTKRPITPNTFKPWCPRLQALELIGYTDWHPHVAGRLIFPTALFRREAGASQFEELPGIRHPDGRLLCLHQPAWTTWRDRFWETLTAVYKDVFGRVQSRYVSLLDVRDEVCRRLRLSPARFELFLEAALHEAPPEGGWHLSIETDMREDLRSGRGRARRPVYVHAVPHTLLAVAQLPSVPGGSRDAR